MQGCGSRDGKQQRSRQTIRWVSCLMMVMLLFCGCRNTADAAGLFAPVSSAPLVLLGEVQCYGDDELKSAYFDTFADKLGQALQGKGIAVRGRMDVTNEAGRHDAADSSLEDRTLSDIHMDAIIHGHRFDRGEAGAKLAHYADDTMGRAYFHDEARIAAWRAQSKQTYFLMSRNQEAVQRIGQKYGADYLLFVNLKEVDVRLKHNLFATHTDAETRGKKLSAALDYYLVRVSDGRVYEGHCENRKTAQLLNFGLGRTGKGMNIDTLLSEVMEAQTNDLVKDMEVSGLPSLR